MAVGSPTGVAGSAVVLANSPTMIGTASVANIAASGYAATTLEGDYSLTGDLSDAAISAASAVRFTGATATTFEGIAAGVSGQILYLHNASPTATLTLADQSDSTDGTAGSKIITGTGADVTLPANTSMSLQYDTAAQRWRVTGTSNVSGSTVSAGTQYEMAYYSAANVVSGDSGIVTDASNDFLVTAGKVGIGITAPAQMLDVNGNINVHTIASGYYIANNEVLFQPGGDTNSIAVGQGAAASQAAGWEANTAVGYQALTANTVGSGNTAQGFQALYSNGGNNNTAVGYGVLHYNWGGSNNTAVGSGALYFSNASQSNNNTAVGAGAGSSLSGGNNTILGYQVASSVLGSGSNNILIGTTQYTDTQSPSDSNTLNIGNLIYGTGLGTTSTAPAGYVGIGTASPNFTLDVSGSARINKPGSSGNILELWGNGGWLVKVPASGSNVVLGTGLTWNGITHPFVYNGSGSNSALTIGGGSSTTGSFLDLESTVGAVNPSNDYIVFGVNNAATEAMRIVHSGAVGIGTTSPNSLLQVYNGEVQVGSSGNTCTSANAGAIRYAGGTVYVCDSTLNWDVLGGAGGGALPSLANGDIWVGNVSNVPTPVALSQDVTITNAGVATVGRIQNVAVGSPTGVAGSAVVLANSPTLTGTASVANIAASGYAATTLESDYSLTGDLSDAAISAASAVRFTGATATTFEGIAAGVSGQILYLHNASPTATLTLADQSDSTDGTAGSKIITGTGADITLPANTSMSLQYDTTAQRWRVTGTSNVSGSTVSAGTQYEMAYYSAANVVSGDSGIVTDASNDLLVTGGKVGIGTTGPAAKLDVYGAIDLNGVNGISQPAGDTTGIAVGNGALGSQTATGLHNVAVGYQALNHDNADDNTALGYQALYSLSVGHHDTAIGSGSDYYDTSGTFNTAIGFGALYLNVGGGDNTIVGAFAGGGSGSWLGGSNNTAVGVSALNQIQGNASNNTSLGAGAGSAITIGNSNIAIGPNVANTILSTGSNNILIGTTQYTDTQSPSDSNTLNIGNLIYGTGLGTTSTAPVGNVGIGTASPNFTLDVSGTARINTPGSSGNVLELWGNGGWIVQVPASGSNVVLGTGLTWNGITHPVVYNGSGFGNPNSALTIAGGSSTTGSFLDLEATWGAASPSDDYIVFGVNNRATEAMRIVHSGAVGIGTASPNSLLQVYNGEVQVGSSGNTCTSANAGAIRYAGGSVYVCDSTLNWDVLGGAGGGALPALANGDIWVGNASNAPTPVALSQDVTITNAGVATVGRIQNVAVGSPTGVAGSAVVLANSPTMIGTASVANIAASGYAATTLEGDYASTGDLDDVAISAASAVRFTGATATTFEGIAAGVSGQILYLHNASPTATLTLADQSDSTDGTAGSKIITGTGADVTLPANTSMSLQYDAAAQRWRVTGTSNVSGSTVSAGTQYEMAYYSAANRISGDSGIVTDAGGDLLVTGGKVGIGTTSPANKLDIIDPTNQVVVELVSKAQFKQPIIKLVGYPQGIGDKVGQLSWVWDGNTVADISSVRDANNTTDAQSDLVFSTSGTERLRIDLVGNIGIGTTSPVQALDVNGNVNVEYKSTSSGYYLSGAQALFFPNNDNTSIAIGNGAAGTTAASPTGTSQNTAVGYKALGGGGYNTAVGYQSLASDVSYYNTAVGNGALQNCAWCEDNTVLGTYAGYSIASGATVYSNTIIGAWSLHGSSENINGSGNTVVGAGIGGVLTSGGYNTIMGAGVASTTLSTGSNNILIGTTQYTDTQSPSDSNTLNIGNLIYGTGLGTTSTAPAGYVGIGTTAPSATLDVQSAPAGTGYAVNVLGNNEVNGLFASAANANAITGTSYGGGKDIYGTGAYATAGWFEQVGFNYYNYSTPVLVAYRNNGGNYNTGAVLHVEDNTASPANLLEVVKQSNYDFVINNSGSVGIGTTSPADTLDVTGTGIHIASGTPGATTYDLYNSGGTLYWNGNALLTSGGSGVISGAGTVNYVARWTPNGVTLGTGTLYDNGTQVGIGTTTPAELLTVAKADSGVYAASSTSAYAPWTSGASAVVQAYNTSATDGGAAYDAFKVTNAAGDAQQAYIGAVSTTGSGVYSPALTFGAQSGAGAYNEYMRITGDGNVGIGTTLPSTSLEVDGVTNQTALTVAATANHPASIYAITANGSGPTTGGIYGSSENGTGIEGVAWLNNQYAIYGHSGRGGAGYFAQTGSIYQTYTSPVLYAYRDNGTVGGNDQTGAILRVEENDTSSGNLLEVVKQSNYKFVINNSGNVGIGTASPVSSLQVATGGLLSVTGAYGAGDTLPAGLTGAGTRMFFYPNKGAFRAGTVLGSEWDDANIGAYSVAMGYHTVASGDYSLAAGMSSASGAFSTSMGWNTSAFGSTSTAMGGDTDAAGVSSVSMGFATYAGGDYSTAMGYWTSAGAYEDIALGQYNVGGGNETTWVATDPVFEIGIGTSSTATANAVTVLKNGNVGIGTANPFASLQILGGSGTTYTLDVSNNYSGGNAPIAIKGAVGGTGGVGVAGYTSGSNGVGVYGQSSQSDGIAISGNNAASTGYGGYFSGGATALYAGGATYAGVFMGGNVGIGTTAPSAPLEVVDNQAAGTSINVVNNNSGAYSYAGFEAASGTATTSLVQMSSNYGSYGAIQMWGGQHDFYIYQDGTFTAYFSGTTYGLSLGTYARDSKVPPTNGLIVSGNVGIGTTAPSQPLTVSGNIDVMGGNSGYLTEIANDTATGTGLYLLAKLNSSGAAVIAGAGDSDGVVGVVMGGNGTTGNAQIAVGGQAVCTFDASGVTAAGDFVTISSTTAGDCHDSGSQTRSGLSSQTIGQVLSTTAVSGSNYPITVALNGSGGGVPAGTTGQVQFNSGSSTFAADSHMTWDNTNKILTIGTGAAVPVATTGAMASFVVNVIPQATVSYGVLGSANTGATVGAATAGQVAYYSGANAISGTAALTISGSYVGVGTAAAGQALTVGGNVDVIGNAVLTEIANAPSGTAANELAKLTSGQAATTAITDTDGVVGIVVGGAGTSGNAQIAVAGQAACLFENAAVAGDFVTIGATTAGQCHDAGATRPASGGETVGRVLASGPAGSAYAVAIAIAPSSGNSGNTAAAFSFTNQTGVSMSSAISSNAVTLSGFSGTLTATCGTGCTAIARNGTWGGTTVSGFQSGDTIAIRQTSSASANTGTNATVTVGTTVSGTWTVTTNNNTASAFSFTNQTGVSGSIPVISNAVVVSGFSGTLTATCNAGCTNIAHNGVWSGTIATGVAANDTIAIQQISSTTTGGTATASVTVGSTVSGTWTVTTGADACPAVSTPGTVCGSGLVYAGVSPDTGAKMYTTPCDANAYWNGSSCTACASGVWTGSGTSCSTTINGVSVGAGPGMTWNNGTGNWILEGVTSSLTGKANTAFLVASTDMGYPYKAADYCASLSSVYGYSDWYLPSASELNVLYSYKGAIGNFNTGGSYYWSSTEYDSYNAWYQQFSGGNQGYYGKNDSYLVRCVRR
ncbi:MAG: DUF1566 domain-containing protein [Alphaproteobacteria bacterium]|nr:DUF1566 domain-containing protein [Alphaproteobacteria bacterium]